MPGPRNVTDWYEAAIARLEHARDRVNTMNGPVVQDDLTTLVDLSRQIEHVYNPDAY